MTLLDPQSAARFIGGYKQLLLGIPVESLAPGARVIEHLVAARSKLIERPELLDDVSGLDPAVHAAARTLQVKNWIYLRDTAKYSIFIDPAGTAAYGVVGVTERLRDLNRGSGAVLETGLVRFQGRFVCDGLISNRVWLGPNYMEDLRQRLKEIRANGMFHKTTDAQPGAPPDALASRCSAKVPSLAALARRR